MFKKLTIGLGLVALMYPFNADAQYGKALQQGVSTSDAIQQAPTSKAEPQPAAASTSATSGDKAASSAQTNKAPAVSVPGTSMKEGEKIEIFFDDFSIKRTMGGQTFCQMTFYVNNNTEKMLDSLMVDISWPGIATNISFSGITPTDLKTIRYALAGDGCYTMGETPTLNITRCVMRAALPNGNIVDVPEETCKQVVVFK